MTVKKAACKIARKLRRFGLSWKDSHKYGKRIASGYINPIKLEGRTLVQALEYEMYDFEGEFERFFLKENAVLHHGDYYDDSSWVEYDVVCLKTGERWHIQECD